MKKNIIVTIILLLGSTLWGVNLTYKDNSKVKTVNIEENGNRYILSKSFFSTTSFSGKKLFIKYTEVTPEIVDEIESKFSFNDVVILSTGEFIYTLDGDDIFYLCDSLAHEENIDTVKPLFNKSVKMY